MTVTRTSTRHRENGAPFIKKRHPKATGNVAQISPAPFCQLQRLQTLFRALFISSVLATPSYAQELAPLENVVDFLVSFLTGAFARSVAIIAVAVLGYLGLTGRLRWGIAGSVIVGIALIFGAATIVDAVSGAV